MHPTLLQALSPGVATEESDQIEFSVQDTINHLEILLQHVNPMVQAASLYLINRLDITHAQSRAMDLLSETEHFLLRETAEKVLSSPTSQSLKQFPRLEKLVYLANSNLFHRMELETMIALVDRAEIKLYSTNEIITDAGDTCREVLLLIEGDARIQHQLVDGLRVEQLQPGHLLDELEVLTRSQLENTIISGSDKTRILTIPVDILDNLLDYYPDIAPRLLEIESRYLEGFMRDRQTVLDFN